MRKTLYDLTENIIKRLKKFPEIEDNVHTIINVEIMAVGCSLIDKNLKLDDAWVLLTGYDEPVIPNGTNKKIISRLRILFAQHSGQAIWEKDINEYFQIPKKYRLIEKNSNGSISFISPRFDPNRKDEYEKILVDPIPRVPINLEYAKAGNFYYSRMKENELHRYVGTIPDSWGEYCKPLQAYRNKKSIDFDLSFNWLEIAKEMDQILGENITTWQNKVKPIQFLSRKGNKIFKYDGIQHIGGGLASGKSTFKTVNTYWLVKKKGAKVGILEENVAQVLERVKELKSLGINAVPIIGKSGRRKYLEKYLLSFQFQSFTDFSSNEILSHFSDVCVIQSLADDLNEDGAVNYPCKSLNHGKDMKKRMCPLAHLCGIYKDWTKLNDAEVWVTTPGAVLHSRIPANIDPLERLIYEAMYDLLDVIFVDEADQVQKGFDEAFMEEHSAFGDSRHLVEKLLQQLNEKVDGKYYLADNNLLTIWKKNLEHLKECVWNLYGALLKSPHIHNFIKNEVIYLNYLIFHISKEISKKDEHQIQVEEIMREFVRESFFSSVGNSEERLHGLINVSSLKDKRKLITEWISKVGGEIKEDSYKLYSKIELFVYLSHIERAMKWIIEYYPIVHQYFDSKVEVPLLRQIKDFRPFMKEAMTGVMLGYRYETKDGSNIGEFKILQYLAIGRQLLNHWANVYEFADDKKGPSIILLSGTSYAPKSLHYHLETEPQWYIKSSKSTSELKQFFIEIRDPTNGEKLVPVSGVKQGFQRDQNLKTIVQELSRKIESELNYWKDVGEYRRVLLVVNSYDDVKTVGDILERSQLWKGRYRLLSQNDQNDNIWFPRSQIEQFASEPEDLLVAPMLAISRGYNILDKNGIGALFGTAFFLIRPYPVPNNLSYFVQILHGSLPLYFKRVKDEGLKYAQAMRKIRSLSRRRFELMYQKPDFWSILDEKEKTILSWYTFIPTWQLMGRLLRGGKNARIYYCDAKFIDKGNASLSMLDYWAKLMSENEEDPLFASLYGPFMKSIKNIEKVGLY